MKWSLKLNWKMKWKISPGRWNFILKWSLFWWGHVNFLGEYLILKMKFWRLDFISHLEYSHFSRTNWRLDFDHDVQWYDVNSTHPGKMGPCITFPPSPPTCNPTRSNWVQALPVPSSWYICPCGCSNSQQGQAWQWLVTPEMIKIWVVHWIHWPRISKKTQRAKRSVGFPPHMFTMKKTWGESWIVMVKSPTSKTLTPHKVLMSLGPSVGQLWAVQAPRLDVDPPTTFHLSRWWISTHLHHEFGFARSKGWWLKVWVP